MNGICPRRVSCFDRLLSVVFIAAATVMLAGCGGPASTVFNTAAPTQAIVPYLAVSSTTGATLVGLRGTDGTEVWRTALGQRDTDAASALVDGVLYIEAGPPGTPSPSPTPGAILAIRLSDGKVLWHTQLPQADYRVGVAADNTTVVAAAGSAGLYALDARTGAVRWHQDAPLSQDLASAPHMSNGVVLALLAGNPARTNTDVALAAWNESDGTRLWQNRVTTAFATNTFAGYTTEGDETTAFSTRDGHTLWGFQSGRTVEGGGADNYHGEVVAVSEQLALVQESFPVVSNDLPTKDYLAALDARTGALRWKYSPGMDGALSFGSPIFGAAGGATTIFGGYQHQIVALRSDDGTAIWKDDLSPYTSQQLMSADTVVFALTYPPACELNCLFKPTNMRLFAFNAATGAVSWERDLPDAVVLAGGA